MRYKQTREKNYIKNTAKYLTTENFVIYYLYEMRNTFERTHREGGLNKKMKRSLYSLILSDEVVARVDELANRAGTNRSHLINEILADHVSLTTPAKHTRRIFEEAEKMLDSLKVDYVEHDNTLCVKSELNYRYRPTLRYDVEIGDGAATLTVSYRTRSTEFDSLMLRFFELWTEAEKACAPNGKTEYALTSGRWVRRAPLFDPNMPKAGKRVSDYVKAFDNALKKYLSGEITADGVKAEYSKTVKNGAIGA